MDSQKFVFLILVLRFALSAYSPCKQTVYDHHILALTWPRQFCSVKSCDQNWEQDWDGQSLIIHGFWPSSQSTNYLNCFNKVGYDPYCHHSYNFNTDLFSDQQLIKLQKYWPQIGPIKDFWQYEWDKHGTCYLYMMKEIYNSSFSNGQILHKYYMSTVDKLLNANIKLNTKTVRSIQQFSKILNLSWQNYIAICDKKGNLSEIRICFDISQQPGGQKITKCPTTFTRNKCRFPITIK